MFWESCTRPKRRCYTGGQIGSGVSHVASLAVPRNMTLGCPGGSQPQTLHVQPLAGFWHSRGWRSMIMGLRSWDYTPDVLLLNGIGLITPACCELWTHGGKAAGRDVYRTGIYAASVAVSHKKHFLNCVRCLVFEWMPMQRRMFLCCMTWVLSRLYNTKT